jgi:uncharacterized protein YegL
MPVLVQIKKKEFELTPEEEERFYEYVRGGESTGKTHVFTILDRSGSMSSLVESTVDGFNEFINGLKKDPAIRVTLTTFDDTKRVVYTDKALDNIPKLTREQYLKGGMGMTALVDAVCGTLNSYKEQVKPGDKAVVLIITDGLENASQEYSAEDLKKLIKSLDSKKNWTFTYIGANQDSWEIASNWGFKKGNVADYNATRGGTSSVYYMSSMNVGAFSAQSASSTDNMFSDQDKDKLKKAK